MKGYVTLFKMRYLQFLQYRAAALAGIATQVGFGIILILPFYALYLSDSGSFPMEMHAVSSYVWLQQAFLWLIAWNWDGDIVNSITSGSIATELCRPMDVYAMWFTRTLSQRISKATLRMGPVLLVAILMPDPFGLSLPASFGALCFFLVSLILGMLVMVSIVMIVYNTTFHTLTGFGIPQFIYIVMDFLGGQMVPIKFYPPFMYKLCSLLPFGSVSNAPFRIYSGDLAGREAAEAILLQLFWVVALIGGGYIWNRLALRRVVSQGG